MTKDKLINPASSASPKQDKLKEIHAQIHHDQTTKNQRKRKTLKAARENDASQGNNNLDDSKEVMRPRRQRDIFRVLKPGFCIWQNTLHK